MAINRAGQEWPESETVTRMCDGYAPDVLNPVTDGYAHLYHLLIVWDVSPEINYVCNGIESRNGLC